MSRRLRVGNLPSQVGDAELIELFSPHGKVMNAWVVLDRDTRESRCFGFVDMVDEDAAKAAVTALDRMAMLGKTLHVEPARDREERPPRPPGGGFGMGDRNFGPWPRGPFGPRGPGFGGNPRGRSGPPRGRGGPPRGGRPF